MICLTFFFFLILKWFSFFPQHIPQQIKRRSLINKFELFILYIVLSTMTQTWNDHIDHLSHCEYWSSVSMYNKVQKYIHVFCLQCQQVLYLNQHAMEAYYWLDNLRRQYETIRESIPWLDNLRHQFVTERESIPWLDNLRHQYETARESIPTPVWLGVTSTVCNQNHISAWLLEICGKHSQL